MPPLKAAIAASFTAEPLQDALSFWMTTLGFEAEIEFAPYHQIYQELLDPNSLLGRNRDGVNLILLRFEDWQRRESHDGEPHSEAPFSPEDTERNARDLVDALKAAAARGSTPYVVFLCPASLTLDAERRVAFARIEQQLIAQLKAAPGVYPVASAEITALYPEAVEYDEKADQLGHIPYTQKAFAALATLAARKIRALKWPPYKVIALDCDNTLWSGVVGEDGALGVKIDGARQALQRFLLAQRDAGMLLCLCSKNVEEDVFEVLDTHPDMILRRKDIVASKINWQPKSKNLRLLASELSLGLDSFIFLDDNPVECSEVEAGAPEALALLLPESARIPRFMKHVWAFDTLKVTEEDRQRSEMYRQNVEREAFQGTAISFQEFLDGLGLEIEITPMGPEHLARVSQLTQRTNQFNCTTIRRTEAEVKKLCESPGSGCFIVNVKDRFGDYGLVGTVFFTTAGDALYVDTFLLSCRVLGRGVEHRILARLGEVARERGLARVDVGFRPTKKNRPALDFLRIGEAFQEETSDGSIFRFPAEFAQSVAFVPGGAPQESKAEEKSAPAASAAAAEIGSRSMLLRRIAEQLSDATVILDAVEKQRQHERPDVATSYVAPRNAVEGGLAEIWSNVLRVERVGVRDDFFQLGGWSLLAVHLFIQIEKAFATSLPITTLLTAPTIEKLAQVIENREGSKTVSVLVPIQRLGSQPPVFCVHGAMGKVLYFRALALRLGKDRPFWALQARDLEDDEVESVTVEALAKRYLDAIVAEFPQGPYWLAGYCFGSLVALEMAHMLRERNQEVPVVVALEPPTISVKSFVQYPGVTARALSLALRDAWRRPLKGNIEFVRKATKNVSVTIGQRWASLLGKRKPQRPQVVADGGADGGADEEEEVMPPKIRNIYLANQSAILKYRPRPYPGKVALFMVQQSSRMKNMLTEAEWKNLVTGPLETHIVPGGHGEMFAEPDVQTLAAMLKARLDQPLT